MLSSPLCRESTALSGTLCCEVGWGVFRLVWGVFLRGFKGCERAPVSIFFFLPSLLLKYFHFHRFLTYIFFLSTIIK